MSDRPIVILSNRGPLSFRYDEAGALTSRRGAGGLVSGIAPLVAGTDTTWLAAAMSDADRQAAAGGVSEAEGLRVQLVDIDPAIFGPAYDVICNATLWYCFHGLFDLARRPRIDRRWHQAWDAYREVNDGFAKAAAASAPTGAVVLIQDYHLALVGPRLQAARPDLRTVFFAHTPFCEADGLVPLPDGVAGELVAGMAANHAVGFHTARWAGAFRRCAAAWRPAGSPAPTTFVAPLGPDPADLAGTAASDACAEAGAALDADTGDRRLIVRVDRIELSKNVLRGFHAFDELLERRPEWREKVVFAAFVYPSREGLADYLAYRHEAEGLVRRINERWATDTWTPIRFESKDDFPRSVAALQRADVLLVNPIRDGLNLVAKEGMVLNQRDGCLVLSTEAGAWAELGHEGAIRVNPFDVSGTADALHQALSMDPAERATRAGRLRAASLARSPKHWLADQVSAAG